MGDHPLPVASPTIITPYDRQSLTTLSLIETCVIAVSMASDLDLLEQLDENKNETALREPSKQKRKKKSTQSTCELTECNFIVVLFATVNAP